MNRTVPTARLCDTEAEKKANLRRRSKIRAIDKNTLYDIPGRIRKMLHDIESGKHGEVTDLVMAVRLIKDNQVGIITKCHGTSQPEVLHYMACRLEKEILG